MLARLQKFSHWQKGCLVLFVLAAGAIVLDRLLPPPIDRIDTSVVAVDRDGRWLHGFTVLDTDGERRWRLVTDLDAVDPRFIERLVAIEDKRFWSHPGVDLLAVLRASASMLRHGEVVSGASTITMQTARLLEPRPRTISSKIIEMIRAMQIELRLSKEEILELYLTLAPYGGNLQGVRAASLAYFGKEPSQLTDAQQALLIALPQAPEARRPDRRPQNAEKARNAMLVKLERAGQLSDLQRMEAEEVSLPDRRLSFKRLAWHVSYEHREEQARGGEVQLTLDARLQELTERLITERAETSRDKANLAVIVVENGTRKVRAHVGSAGFKLSAGWIDMTQAERSPGSTLKPFIYGIAFEDGFAGGETLVDDAPYTFDGYRPENFTRVFHGDVTVAEALQHSLNVPAVLALDKIGPRRFAASLDAAGIDIDVPNRAASQESLAIALGGVGLTARDLATLYAGLANGGKVAPLKWLEEDFSGKGIYQGGYQLVSDANADRLTRIMQEAPAPAGRSPALLAVNAPQIAFKTGTSYGYRDAWAAGYTEDYTVIVWSGHANGTPRPGITGRQAALPLLYDIFDRLQSFETENDAIMESDPSDAFETGAALARLAPLKRDLPPEIVFPEDGITIFYSDDMQDRGLSLSARGGAGAFKWYVDGTPLLLEEGGQRSIWHPPSAGFYQVTVVDGAGQQSTAAVQILAAG